MHPNRFQDGTAKAFLRPDQMKVKKWQPGNAFYGRATGLLNVAFENYFNARQGINAVADSDHKKKMLSELEDCACDGFGVFGVDDLDEAFQHLTENNGTWTDDSTLSYSGMFQKSLGGPCIDVPKAACTYCTAVEKRVKELKMYVDAYHTEAAKIPQAIDASNWAVIQVGLKSMKENGDRAKKLMWFAPANVGEVLGKPLESAVSFIGILNDIDTAVRDIDKLKNVGLNTQAAVSLQVMQFVTKKVPVLGSFYSEIISKLPDFFENMKQLFDDRREKILSYAQMK